ncbi:hypothetical protein [Flavobacterium reichenbachii]|uniref:Uncharacterized protein n=1 Tax=Flavobacterium reichenbachii TaxID=362418 RepID=A0A085ZIL4_9FLAO|nr:hypothetical protein [Flavobacterium reichenbachii]KFF04278.1 hypothetical protein IW19_01490 [Flavobacterium reichenbachii]OXB13826.1 hypothetical protein B0A68_13830 [Flavobacterium reichenbachii]
MDESKTKVYRSYDLMILDALFVKYGVSKYYIRKCLAGNANGTKPDSIRKDYQLLEKAVKDAIAGFLK